MRVLGLPIEHDRDRNSAMVEEILPILVCILVGSSIFLFVWALFRYPVPTEPPIHRRLAVELGADRRNTLFENKELAPIVAICLTIAQRFTFTPLRDRIRRDLNAAGNPNNYSVDEYVAICLFVAIAMGLAFGVIELLLVQRFDVLLMLLMTGIGFYIPMMSLAGEAKKRCQRISKKLPYTLDLIALMMAAGSTFTEAIDTIIHDEPEDDFNQELRLVRAEIEFGTRRSEALRNLAARIPLETLRSIVGAVNQAESLGTPLSTILKSQSTSLRNHRSVRAEKLSSSASLRILIPTMLILAAVVLMLFGPFIMRFFRGDLLVG